jgi:hypothetical protein
MRKKAQLFLQLVPEGLKVKCLDSVGVKTIPHYSEEKKKSHKNRGDLLKFNCLLMVDWKPDLTPCQGPFKPSAKLSNSEIVLFYCELNWNLKIRVRCM